jgi:2-dehydro-3-deoxyphosphogluconate aldolase / (4S)-4-hydroxy-2-oxoglutarate aldolase
MSLSVSDVLSRAPVIPVLTIDDIDTVLPLARALVAGGLPVIEVTMRTKIALDAIRRVRELVPDCIVGAGTVLGPRELARAVEAGAQFAMSPGTTDALLQAGRGAPIPYIPGIESSSDIMRGLEAGYDKFKFFPAEVAGGVRALQAFAGPFPHVQFCPTGGIDANNAPQYLGQRNVLCVGGSWIATKGDLGARDFAIVEQRASEASRLIRRAA